MLLAKFCHQEDSLIVHGASVPVHDSAFRLFTITPCPWWCHSGDKCCHCKPCFPQSETKVWLKTVLALPVVLRIECQHNFTCMRLHVRHSYIYGPSSASSPTTVLARVLAVPLMLFWISCNDDQLQSIPDYIFDLHQFRVPLHPSKPTGPCLLTEKEEFMKNTGEKSSGYKGCQPALLFLSRLIAQEESNKNDNADEHHDPKTKHNDHQRHLPLFLHFSSCQLLASIFILNLVECTNPTTSPA